jgi:3-dehydroquinate dehydratase-2
MATPARKRSGKTGSGRRPPTILVLQGANLNLLGTREPHIYGHETLDDVHARLGRTAKDAGFRLQTFQSNHEGAIVDRIHAARGEVDFVLINPAAFTHTSVAIRDALAGVAIPFVEIHLTNVHAREAFRHHSYFSDKAVGTVVGLGSKGYDYALAYAMATIGGK